MDASFWEQTKYPRTRRKMLRHLRTKSTTRHVRTETQKPTVATVATRLDYCGSVGGGLRDDV
jgi:hypothetical protein